MKKVWSRLGGVDTEYRRLPCRGSVGAYFHVQAVAAWCSSTRVVVTLFCTWSSLFRKRKRCGFFGLGSRDSLESSSLSQEAAVEFLACFFVFVCPLNI